MTKSIRATPKKRGRPPTGGRGDGIMVRFKPDPLAHIDGWAAEQEDEPSRPEAIRRLVALGLSAPAPKRKGAK
jgi:hypothetical protein